MNLREIHARQQAIRAELRGLDADEGADGDPRGDLVDELLTEYERLEATRSTLRRIRVLKALRPGLGDPAGEGGFE
jgi:hypothetical protein